MDSSCIMPYSLQTPEWLVFLRLICAVAEGSLVFEQTLVHATSAACVRAVLNDPQRRIAVLGGRVDMPRSLGSVYGGAVTRFLGGFRGGVLCPITTSLFRSFCNGVAVSRDGSLLLISNEADHAIYVCSVHTGAVLQCVGGFGTGPLQFRHPQQVWVASDGFVFVADYMNNRIQILTPRFEFEAFVGLGLLSHPAGVCANDDVIIASSFGRISVFKRNDATFIRCFEGGGNGLCFMSGHKNFASAECCGVCVYTLEGELVRRVGVEILNCTLNPGVVCSNPGVACSDADELIVADWMNKRIVMFSASGEIVWTSETLTVCNFTGVAVHNGAIYAQTSANVGKCFLFS